MCISRYINSSLFSSHRCMLGASPDNVQVLWILNCTVEDHCLKDKWAILFSDFGKEADMSPIFFSTEEQKYEVRWESQRRGLWDPCSLGIAEDLFFFCRGIGKGSMLFNITD